MDNYDEIKKYFDTLNKEDIIFEDSETLFEVCKIIVCERFASEDEDKYLYYENVKNLCALMQAVQPWYIKGIK